MSHVMCSIPGCGKKLFARGWCAAHYGRWKRHGDPRRGGPPRTRDAPIRHGTTDGYSNRGCRCDDCKAAHAARAHRYYKANREEITERARQYYEDNREKVNERCSAYYEANREAVMAAVRNYMEANPHKVSERRRRWREANPEHSRQWRKANPEKAAKINSLASKRRRARERDAFIEDVVPIEVFERDEWRCQILGCLYPDTPVSLSAKWPDPISASIDHIIPLAKGGMHERSNLATAHLRCNIVKSDRAGVAREAQLSPWFDEGDDDGRGACDEFHPCDGEQDGEKDSHQPM